MSQPFAPSTLPPNDAVRYAMGEYIQIHGKCDSLLVYIAATLLDVGISDMLLICSDLGTKARAQIIRQAAKKKLGPTSTSYQSLHKALSGFVDRGKFRNDIVHGTYLWDDEAVILGRPLIGVSPKYGGRRITYEDIKAETEKLHQAGVALQNEWHSIHLKLAERDDQDQDSGPSTRSPAAHRHTGSKRVGSQKLTKASTQTE